MSRIYFHAKDADAEIRGSERAFAGCLTNDIGIGLLMAQFSWGDAQKRLIASLGDTYAKDEKGLRLMLNGDADRKQFALADGTHARAWPVILNTAMRVGSRPVKLLARMHAQCEIHMWVDGPNREWLATIIAEGLRDGIMRGSMGWESVVEMLRDGDGPVVTSYSVCEPFPNPTAADWSPPEDEDGDEDWDAWYEIDQDTRWDMAMQVLRDRTGGLELKPENFDVYSFGAGLTAFDLRERLLPLEKVS